MTLHRLLEFQPQAGTFARDRGNPLDADLLVAWQQAIDRGFRGFSERHGAALAPALAAQLDDLSFAPVGDAVVGERVNYGAGSITANYDGANKHRTVIGPDVHVGSNCVLVAPVTLGEGATIGGGSTIAKDVPAGKLAVARARQVVLDGWTRPVKKK